jgi:hypothetical protein
MGSCSLKLRSLLPLGFNAAQGSLASLTCGERLRRASVYACCALGSGLVRVGPPGAASFFVRCLRVEACPSFCLLGGDPLLLTGSGIFGLVGATAGRLAFSGQT